MRVLDRPQRSLDVRHGDNGVVYLSCGIPYQDGPLLIDLLERAKNIRPDVPFLAERDADGGWRNISYSQVWRDSGAIATWLIRHGFGPDRPPVMILSENSIQHALLVLGTLRAGAAAVPVSPTYSFGNDLGRLGKMLDTMPNVYTEVGAVLYDIGRQPRAAHDFFVKYQDRLLFGKDSFQPEEYPYYWRVFETKDDYFDYYRDYHAFWKLYGIDLPDDVLKKVYYKNALKLTPSLPQGGFPR